MLCTHCADIDLTNSHNGYRYALLDSQKMSKSSEAGCEGCSIFLSMAEMHFGKPLSESDPTPPGLHIQLRRYSAEDSRVDLEFLESKGAPKLRGSVGLRLCSAYGMEPSLQATYKRKDDFYQGGYYDGELVSENLVVDGIPLGRLVSNDSGNRECLDVAASWLERCSRQHEYCSEHKNVELPTRLVHIPNDESQYLSVQDTGGQTGSYVALSHCWGSGIAFKTTRATFNARNKGFPMDVLARNFRDAICIARNLGFQYIWIDALCIVQDSLDDWATESSKMAQVYGNASLTISADLASDSDFGILHPRNNMTSHHFGTQNELCLQTRGEGWAAIPQMPLTRRGWAFQERILSSRVLHFLQEQIAWECNTTVYLEEHYARQLGHSMHFSKHNLTWALNQPPKSEKNQGSLHKSSVTVINNEKYVHAVNPSGKIMDLDTRVTNWNICVSELAVRHFTKDSDKLPSLSGLASAMEVPELGEYLVGIWEKSPFLSMAWFARWPQAPPTPYRAPSWSWAATMGQIIWYKGFDNREPTLAEKSAWDVWNSKFGPQLICHQVLHKTVDLKGEVLEGTHIVVRGFCRDVYIKEMKDSRFDEWEWIHDYSRRPGKKVHMDSRGGNRNHSWDSISYFNEDLEDLVDRIDTADLKRYTCIQIEREKARELPKILALILESIDGTENQFRRVGLLVFDDCTKDVASLEWMPQTLVLI